MEIIKKLLSFMFFNEYNFNKKTKVIENTDMLCCDDYYESKKEYCHSLLKKYSNIKKYSVRKDKYFKILILLIFIYAGIHITLVLSQDNKIVHTLILVNKLFEIILLPYSISLAAINITHRYDDENRKFHYQELFIENAMELLKCGKLPNVLKEELDKLIEE